MHRSIWVGSQDHNTQGDYKKEFEIGSQQNKSPAL